MTSESKSLAECCRSVLLDVAHGADGRPMVWEGGTVVNNGANSHARLTAMPPMLPCLCTCVCTLLCRLAHKLLNLSAHFRHGTAGCNTHTLHHRGFESTPAT